MDTPANKWNAIKTILDDQPWGQGRCARHWDPTDPLGFSSLAELMAEVITENEPNLTVGIYGNWGSGKTSLMRMLEKRLNVFAGVSTVWFDAWEQHHLANPLLGLCTAIKQQLDEKESDGSFLTGARAVVSKLCKSVPISGVNLAGFGVNWERAGELADLSREHASAIRELREVGRSLNQDSPDQVPRIVVFVDNLDRCSADSSVSLLESIKLVFGEPGFVFVLAVMPGVIESHVAGRLKLDSREGASSSRYLDKMIQLTFRIPGPSLTTTNAYVDYLCREISVPEELATGIRPFFVLLSHAGGTIGTPRSMKRFMNEWAIGLRAMARTESSGTDADLAPAVIHRALDRACALALRYCWPTLCRRAVADPATVVLQLREAANVLEDQRLVSKRLAELSEAVDDAHESQAIREGLAFRGYLGLQRVRAFLGDLDRVRFALREPTAPIEGELLENPYDEGSADVIKREIPGGPILDASRRFSELSIRYNIEPSERLANEIVRMISTNLDRLDVTAVGNTLVRLGESYSEAGTRAWELLDKAGKLGDWRHASQYVMFLLIVKRDIDKAEAVMNRFSRNDFLGDPQLEYRWQTCKAMLGSVDETEELFRLVKADPSNQQNFIQLLSALTFQRGLREADARKVLEALALYTQSQSLASEKYEMIRATGDLLARGTGDIARAAGALFWALRWTELWDSGTQHNLASVTFTDFNEKKLARALWTLAYSASRNDRQIQMPLATAFSGEFNEPEAALAVVNGQPLPNEEQRVQEARVVVDDCVWDSAKITEALSCVFPADWSRLVTVAEA